MKTAAKSSELYHPVAQSNPALSVGIQTGQFLFKTQSPLFLGAQPFRVLGDIYASPTPPTFRSSLVNSLIGLSVSEPLSPPPGSLRVPSEVENASLRSPGSLAHKNVVDPPIATGVSQGGLDSSIHQIGVLDCEDKICDLAGSDSSQDGPLSGSLGSLTNNSACELVSSLVAIGPTLSTDPQASYQLPCRDELPRLSPQRAAIVDPNSVPISGHPLGTDEYPPSITWSSVVKQYTPRALLKAVVVGTTLLDADDGNAESGSWSFVDD
ncbi:hypothetical protein Nepgr_021105 [Nepenthes gracilis]|uniref:Uncharacterized protein n=1 Tax=Nepenthes gracilis TaxID=150966 RepID=A0AAD3SYX3_NEPGR|nr:hypothetical protein Nepgr_021105 [Nepenthes gracilis]